MKQELYDIAQYTLEELTRNGAAGAEVSLSRGRGDEANMDAGEFSLIRTTFSTSVSIRALIGTKKGSAGINSFDKDAIRKAAAEAVEAAKSSEPDDAEYIADGIGGHDFPADVPEADLDAMYESISRLVNTSKTEYPKVDFMQVITAYKSGASLYANTNGSRLFSQSGYYSFSATFSARDGERVTSIYGADFRAHTLDKPVLDYAYFRRILAEMEPQLDTVPVSGKFVGTVLMSEDCLASMLGSVLGNTVTDAPLIMNVSPWRNKIGERVADSRLNIKFAPLDKRIVGSSCFTSDGHLVEEQEIIKDGKLAGFALSQYGARKTGLRRGTASGGLIVAPGTTPSADMITGIENGLFVNRFSGGEPAQNGDFSGVAKNSFLIKDGKITDAVSETMISGNLFDMLNNITAISVETVVNGYNVLPWMSFGGVTISGK